MVRRLAILVSRVFGPFSVIPLVSTYVLVFDTGLAPDVRMRVAVVLLGLFYVAPLAFAVYLLKTGKVSDADMTKREERFGLLGVTLVYYWLGYGVLTMMPTSAMFGRVLFLIVVSFTVAAILTMIDKISLHALGVTVLALTLFLVYGSAGLAFFAVVVAVAWSRLYLGKHNLRQLLLGALVPICVFLTENTLMLEWFK